MERGEPTLVPEWLRSTGNVSGGGNSAHHSHKDVSTLTNHTRNRNSKSNSDFDSPRFLDRSSSSNSRRNSSNNGSAKHPYSSFGRSHRDRDKDRDKKRPSYVDPWDHDCSDTFRSISASRSEKDKLWRSNSMVSRKQVEGLPQGVLVDLKNRSSRTRANGNGLTSLASVSANSHSVFQKDFPSLGSEEKQRVPEVGRVGSPGLSSVVHVLPVGSSGLLGSEGWTSALVEVPTVIGSSNTGSLCTVQTSDASVPGISNAMAGLNMAEALAQAPSKTRAAPQISVQTQRLEELAMRQSRQLIPVTPSMPKSSVLNSSDKSKTKMVARSGEMSMVAKSVHQQPAVSQYANQLVPAEHNKSDPSKTSYGRLFILKQNGAPPCPKELASPTTNAGRAASGQTTTSAVVPSAPSKSSKNPKISSTERKSASLELISGFNMEKKPTLSQTQSRSDFFKLLKEKTTANTSAVSSPRSDKSCEVSEELTSASESPQAIKNGAESNCNGGHSEEFHIFSEEETAFLRSLGWEESTDADEGLTEEEITAFYQEYMKLKPSLKVSQGVQQKLLELQTSNLVGVAAESTSSDSESEA